MTPTPEQVAQWAREAGVGKFNDMNLYEQMALYRLVTRAMAEQAEADAKLADDEATIEGIAQRCAAAIRANAPKA